MTLGYSLYEGRRMEIKGLPQRIRINERISYWRATNHPLSSDIGVIEGDAYTWIFDVGSSEAAMMCIQELPGNKNIILSHFHRDHSGNLKELEYEKLYVGAHTKRYTQVGEVVSGHLHIADGVGVHLFEIPCSHAKGCIGVEVDGTYAFLGDAMYCTMKKNRVAYNTNLLREEIGVLESLQAEYFFISHDKRFMRRKEVVLRQLKNIYMKRDKESSYIYL